MQEIYAAGFDPWVGKIPWRRAWHPTAVFLPGKSHRQRSLEGYSSWGCKELDTTGVTAHTQAQLSKSRKFEIIQVRKKILHSNINQKKVLIAIPVLDKK